MPICDENGAGGPVEGGGGDNSSCDDGLNVKSPPIHDYYGEKLWQRKRAIEVPERSLSYLQMAMRDESGNNVDLTQYGFVNNDPCGEDPATSSGSSGSSETPVEPGDNQLLTIFRESALQERYRWTAVPTVYDAVNGIIKVQIPDEVVNHTGIYLAESGVLDANDRLLWSNEVYVFVTHSAWHLPATRILRGPPTIDDIRTSLRDSDPAENELLTDLDFGLSELCFAATRAVQFWNDQPPHISTAVFSTKTFPFREIWITGVHLFLFQLAEEHYRRNFFQTSAGGTVTDDKNRHREYNQVYRERLAQFKELVLWQKAQLNLRRGWGTFGGGYPY